MKVFCSLLLAMISTYAIAQTKLFYNSKGELTIEELASHYRIAKINTTNKKFSGLVEEYDLNEEKILEIHYDDGGVKNGNFKYERFGISIQGNFKDNIPDFAIPDTIMNLIQNKENFAQAIYIRKNDYQELKMILSPIQQSKDSVVVNGEVYRAVEEMPKFPGGMTSLSGFLGYHLAKFEDPKHKGVSGKVFVEFTIMTDGTIDNVKVIKGIGPEHDKAAAFAISKLPDWKPGYQRGKAVPVRMVLPISFE